MLRLLGKRTILSSILTGNTAAQSPGKSAVYIGDRCAFSRVQPQRLRRQSAQYSNSPAAAPAPTTQRQNWVAHPFQFHRKGWVAVRCSASFRFPARNENGVRSASPGCSSNSSSNRSSAHPAAAASPSSSRHSPQPQPLQRLTRQHAGKTAPHSAPPHTAAPQQWIGYSEKSESSPR